MVTEMSYEVARALMAQREREAARVRLADALRRNGRRAA
jgi:hypothetical protein